MSFRSHFAASHPVYPQMLVQGQKQDISGCMQVVCVQNIQMIYICLRHVSVCVTHVYMLSIHMGRYVCVWFGGHMLPDLFSCAQYQVLEGRNTIQGGNIKMNQATKYHFPDNSSCEIVQLPYGYLCLETWISVPCGHMCWLPHSQ